MGVMDWLRGLFKKREEQPIIKDVKKDLPVMVKQEEPILIYEKPKREPLIPASEMLPADRKEYLLERQSELEQELKEIAEELQELSRAEMKPEIEDFRAEFTESESKLRDRVYDYIYDIPQMTLTEFTQVVRSPDIAERKKYGLDAKGFGGQNQNLVKRIYQYAKASGGDTGFIKRKSGLKRSFEPGIKKLGEELK